MDATPALTQRCTAVAQHALRILHPPAQPGIGLLGAAHDTLDATCDRGHVSTCLSM